MADILQHLRQSFNEIMVFEDEKSKAEANGDQALADLMDLGAEAAHLHLHHVLNKANK